MADYMKPIETVWRGCKFRSRLEARWAIFFQALGLKWEYEPQGFELGEAGCYLPDFYIHTATPTWLEIKPHGEIGDKDEKKLIAFDRALSEQADRVNKVESLDIIAGRPWPGDYQTMFVSYDWKRDENGELQKDTKVKETNSCTWTQCPMCKEFGTRTFEAEIYDGLDGVHCHECFFDVYFGWNKRQDTDKVWRSGGCVISKDSDFFQFSPDLMRAYKVARSARWEHGQQPNV